MHHFALLFFLCRLVGTWLTFASTQRSIPFVSARKHPTLLLNYLYSRGELSAWMESLCFQVSPSALYFSYLFCSDLSLCSTLHYSALVFSILLSAARYSQIGITNNQKKQLNMLKTFTHAIFCLLLYFYPRQTDILTPLPALGIDFTIIPGKGPKIINPIASQADVNAVGAMTDVTAQVPFIGPILKVRTVSQECANLLLSHQAFNDMGFIY